MLWRGKSVCEEVGRIISCFHVVILEQWLGVVVVVVEEEEE